MVLHETLNRLNLAAVGDNIYQRLWTQLEQEFYADPQHANEDFAHWALCHVSRDVLSAVTDTSFKAITQAFRQEVTRRWTAALRNLNASLGLVVFLFGTEIAGSRPSAQGASALSKSHPAVDLVQLHDRYKQQPAHPDYPHAGERTLKDVTRFRAVIVSYGPDIWPKKNNKSSSNGNKTSKSKTAPSGTPDDSDSEVESPRRARAPSLPAQHDDSLLRSPKPSHLQSPSIGDSRASDLFSPKAQLNPQSPPPGDQIVVAQAQPALPPDPLHMDQPEDDNDADMTSDFSFGDDSESCIEIRPTTPMPHQRGATRSKSPSSPGQIFAYEGLSTIIEEPDDSRVAQSEDDELPARQETGGRSIGPECPSSSSQALDADEDVSCLSPQRSHITVRRKRKRGPEEARSSDASFPPQPIHKGLQQSAVAQLQFTPDTPRPPQKVQGRRVDLRAVVDSLPTLGAEGWLNDLIIYTIAKRLRSPHVGVVDSLTIASQHRTERGRLQLQSEFAKEKVLLLLNHENTHWVLFVWTPASKTLAEYDSMASTSACTRGYTGNDLVPNFLRWVTRDPNLPIAFSNPKCPQQPNNWDCGIYMLLFAANIAKHGTIPADIYIDGVLERGCLRRALLTSWHCALRPDDLSRLDQSMPQTTAERAVHLKTFLDRRKNLKALAKSYTAHPSRGAFRTQLTSMAGFEEYQFRQTALAGVIHSLHDAHSSALRAALDAQAETERQMEVNELDAALRKQVNGFVAALDAFTSAVPSPATSLPASCRRRVRNLAAMRENALLAEEEWGEWAEEETMSADASRDNVRCSYLWGCVLLLILRYATAKFRHVANDAL